MFDPACPFSRRSLAAWDRIAATLAAEGQRSVVGILVAKDEVDDDGVTGHPAAFPVVRFPGRNVAAMYRSGIVPQIMIVDPAGRVLYARTGVLESPAAVDTVLRVWSRVAGAEASLAHR